MQGRAALVGTGDIVAQAGPGKDYGYTETPFRTRFSIGVRLKFRSKSAIRGVHSALFRAALENQ
jgi:hypothetical protein